MQLAPEVVAAIAERLAERAGLELPAWVVDARAAARIALLDVVPDAYLALLDGGRGAGELAELVELVRVGESRLFRHRSQITALVELVVPALRARGQRSLRVWSAGCAAGEEPYTLAIVLARALPECAISILATDVSGDALAQAETATYPRAALHYVPEPYRDAFVDGGGDGTTVCVAPAIAALVRFERQNLLDGAAPRGCDLVWCRNVLIYFTDRARRRAIDRLVGATVPGGFVFIGYSESLRDIPELEAMRANDAVYYMRRGGDRAAIPGPASDRKTAPIMLAPPLADERTPIPVPIRDRKPAPLTLALPLAPADDRTPPPIRFTLEPPADDTLVLRGHAAAALVTAELSARLAQRGLRSLTIDLDGADLLGDDLAPVLRRARAAARTAGILLIVRATRTGGRRWLARHSLDEDVA
ncbi:MAG TPA: CheR family methyltransferase [Kofleriaceae bacterium]|jgi:chemotaxis protein methyltransferase CheR|nr:CheR family methyltransferase [Kofleriaceae bacterium]